MTPETNTPAAETPVTNGGLRKRGVTDRTKRAIDTLKAVSKERAPAQAKDKAPKTFTSVDLANEHGINAKTLRARIRRNIDKWEPLFVNGEKHVFADNATTRKAVAALLAANA